MRSRSPPSVSRSAELRSRSESCAVAMIPCAADDRSSSSFCKRRIIASFACPILLIMHSVSSLKWGALSGSVALPTTVQRPTHSLGGGWCDLHGRLPTQCPFEHVIVHELVQGRCFR